MLETPSWVAPWVIDKITGERVVTSATRLSNSLIKLVRQDLPDLLVALVHLPVIDATVVASALNEDPHPQFIANLAPESHVTGDAIQLSEREKLPVGRFSDLARAARLADVSSYRHPEIAYAEQGLDQHSAIASYERLDERRYTIHRTGRPDRVVILLDDYELTGDSLRNAWAKYGEFEWVILTNPNLRGTENASLTAETMGVRLLTWREFFKAARKDD